MTKRNIVKVTKTIEVTKYIGSCKECGKKIEGSTESQVNYNLMVHEMTHEGEKKNE